MNHTSSYQSYQYSQRCLHSTRINTFVNSDQFLWLQREEWLHKPGLRWNLPGTVHRNRKTQLCPRTTPPARGTPFFSTKNRKLEKQLWPWLEWWPWWVLPRLRRMMLRFQMFQMNDSLQSLRCKDYILVEASGTMCLSHWDFSNWIFNSYKASHGILMVLHSQSPTVKLHSNGPRLPGRFLSDRKVTCIARFRAPLLHIFQHGSGLKQKNTNPKLIHVYSISQSSFLHKSICIF